MKRVLVTGGAGFIGGRHLCERLLAQGREVCREQLLHRHAPNIVPLLNHPELR